MLDCLNTTVGRLEKTGSLCRELIETVEFFLNDEPEITEYEEIEEELQNNKSVPDSVIKRYDKLQRKIPETGNHPAILLRTGHLFTFPETHVTFLTKNKIRPQDVQSGGWVTDGQYEPSDYRSDTMRWVKQKLAQQRVAKKRNPVKEEASSYDCHKVKYPKSFLETINDWLYKQNLIENEELSDDVKAKLEKILKDGIRNEDITFGPMFPNERTYIDLRGDSIVLEPDDEVVEFLDKKGYEIVDYDKGLAKQKNGNREIKIGKLLKDEPELIHIFETRKEQADKTTENMQVVFTYKPEDIALMSTGRRWTSCANLKGMGPAAQQIPNKLKFGGMVAYLIDKKDKDIKEPYSRISIRRFVSEDDGSFGLIPETTCYGDISSEFTETVTRITKESNDKTLTTRFGIFKDAEGGYSDSLPDDAQGLDEIEQRGKLNNISIFLNTLNTKIIKEVDEIEEDNDELLNKQRKRIFKLFKKGHNNVKKIIDFYKSDVINRHPRNVIADTPDPHEFFDYLTEVFAKLRLFLAYQIAFSGLLIPEENSRLDLHKIVKSYLLKGDGDFDNIINFLETMRDYMIEFAKMEQDVLNDSILNDSYISSLDKGNITEYVIQTAINSASSLRYNIGHDKTNLLLSQIKKIKSQKIYSELKENDNFFISHDKLKQLEYDYSSDEKYTEIVERHKKHISEDVKINSHVIITDNGKIEGKVKILDGNIHIRDNALLTNTSKLTNHYVPVSGEVLIYGNAIVDCMSLEGSNPDNTDDYAIQIGGNARVEGNVDIEGYVTITDDAIVIGDDDIIEIRNEDSYERIEILGTSFINQGSIEYPIILETEEQCEEEVLLDKEQENYQLIRGEKKVEKSNLEDESKIISEDSRKKKIPLIIDDDLPGTEKRAKKLQTSEEIRKHNLQAYLMDFFWDNDLLDSDIIDSIDNIEKNKDDIEPYLWKLNEKRTVDEIYDYLFLDSDGEYEELGREDIENFEVSDDVFEWAKTTKGVTDSLRLAGYVLPDGELLDFSGHRHGADGGSRQEDHRQLNLPVKGNLSGTDLMVAFMNLGAIRIDANSGMVDISTKPTTEQLQTIRSVLKDGGYVDMVHGDKRESFEVDDNRMALGKIQRFFN